MCSSTPRALKYGSPIATPAAFTSSERETMQPSLPLSTTTGRETSDGSSRRSQETKKLLQSQRPIERSEYFFM